MITHLAGQGASPPRVHPSMSDQAGQRGSRQSLPRVQVLRHLQGDKAGLQSSQEVKPKVRSNRFWTESETTPPPQLREESDSLGPSLSGQHVAGASGGAGQDHEGLLVHPGLYHGRFVATNSKLLDPFYDITHVQYE